MLVTLHCIHEFTDLGEGDGRVDGGGQPVGVGELGGRHGGEGKHGEHGRTHSVSTHGIALHKHTTTTVSDECKRRDASHVILRWLFGATDCVVYA